MTHLLPCPEISAEQEPGEIAYVLFTSGSTGRPKGVAMRTSVVARLIAWHVGHPRLGQAARTLQFAPLSFDVSFQEIWSTLATGGVLVLPSESERKDPYALLDLIARERIERLFLPYVALQALAEAVARRWRLSHALEGCDHSRRTTADYAGDRAHCFPRYQTADCTTTMVRLKPMSSQPWNCVATLRSGRSFRLSDVLSLTCVYESSIAT